MSEFTVGSLFSGIGGLDLACEMAGFKTLWQVEKNDFCRQVLHKHWPDAAQHSDIFDCHDLPYVDLLTAGFPCQPFSIAGSRKGKDDERYLIPEMFRIIRELQPRAILFENVRGFTNIDDGHVFRDFLRAVADCGYDAEWACLRASDFGAPHQRERIFIVAYTQRPRLHKPIQAGQRAHSAQASRGLDNRLKRPSANVDTPVRASRNRSPLKRGVARTAHGLAGGLDFPGFPAGQGTYQHPYEPPRTVEAKAPHHKERVQALGNAVVPQQAYPLAQAIHDWLVSYAL